MIPFPLYDDNCAPLVEPAKKLVFQKLNREKFKGWL